MGTDNGLDADRRAYSLGLSHRLGFHHNAIVAGCTECFQQNNFLNAALRDAKELDPAADHRFLITLADGAKFSITGPEELTTLTLRTACSDQRYGDTPNPILYVENMTTYRLVYDYTNELYRHSQRDTHTDILTLEQVEGENNVTEDKL